MNILPSATSRAAAAFALVAWAVLSHPARAQDPRSWSPTVAVGSRVRVAIDSPAVSRIVGEYRGAAREALHLTVSGQGAMAIPVRQVIYLDAGGGRDRMRYLLKGAKYGAAAGAVVGGLASDQGDLSDIAGLIGGALLGVTVGAIGGAMLAPERWVRHVNYSRGSP